jgi:hypothetical protein
MSGNVQPSCVDIFVPLPFKEILLLRNVLSFTARTCCTLANNQFVQSIAYERETQQQEFEHPLIFLHSYTSHEYIKLLPILLQRCFSLIGKE